MTRRRILLTILLALALVVTASAVIEAAQEVAAESSRGPEPVSRVDRGTVVVRRTAVVGAMAAAQRTVTGDANFADPIHGSEYLAMRLDRGTPVTITGAGGTWTTRTTDYGPAKWTGDIADIALVRFADVCGWTVAEARLRGECQVTVAVGGPVPTLPATSTEGETP